jgi:hypothetical protein
VVDTVPTLLPVVTVIVATVVGNVAPLSADLRIATTNDPPDGAVFATRLALTQVVAAITLT